MTRLSLRYVSAVSVCLLVALVPVVVHSYLHIERDDCKGAPILMAKVTTSSFSPGNRDTWMRETFESSQWSEGSFVSDGVQFEYSVIRSYDAKRLYHRPENYFANRAYVQGRGVEWVNTGSGNVPIHRTYYVHTSPAILVAYLLVYHSAPVANPYWAQLRAAPVELWRGRRPMTLFLIQARGSPVHFGKMEVIARDWLLSQWDSYRSICTQ